MIKLTDNSLISKEHKDNELINNLVNKTLSSLTKENLFILPSFIEDSKDLDEDSCLFLERNNQIRTSNLVGFLRRDDNEIRITSRFYTSKNGEDFFTRYLIKKVLNVNIIRSELNSDKTLDYYDLLVFLFPVYFNLAMRKGVYKEYTSREYNNSNLKGKIIINRHVKENTPFIGNISYRVREFSFDNDITQLIRHAYEKIKTEYKIDSFCDNEFETNIRILEDNTRKYSKIECEKILRKNISTRIRHSFFEEYYLLQDICIRILSNDRIGFGNEDNEVHGILVDISWLWEEYLAILLSPYFIHSNNKTRENPIYIYKNSREARFPDFYSNKIILDAKYKNVIKNENGDLNRDDLYQIIGYLHVKKSVNWQHFSVQNL